MKQTQNFTGRNTVLFWESFCGKPVLLTVCANQVPALARRSPSPHHVASEAITNHTSRRVGCPMPQQP